MMMIRRRCRSGGSLLLRPTSTSSTSTSTSTSTSSTRRLLSIETTTTTTTLTSKSPMADEKNKKKEVEESLASPSSSSVPWLMLSTPQNLQSRYMYDLLPEVNNNMMMMMTSLRLNQEIHLPEIAGHHCIGSSQGFLITIDISPTTQIHATNPLTGARLPLPSSLPPLAHLKVCRSWNFHKYGFRRNWMTPPQPPVLVDNKLLSLYHAKAILSPSLTHIFVLLKRLPPLLARVGHDTSWTSSSHSHSSILDLDPKHISDSIFHKGFLHVLWDTGNITSFDLNGNSPNDLNIRFVPSSPFTKPYDLWPVMSLVESPDGDDLFLLLRTVSFPGSSSYQISLNLHTPEQRAITLGFKVFKLHVHNHVHVWRKVECLGHLALFVGHGSSLALSVPDQKNNLSSATTQDGAGESLMLLPNCIYFTDQTSKHIDILTPNCVGDTGVFNLGDGSIQFFNLTDGRHNFNWPLPQCGDQNMEAMRGQGGIQMLLTTEQEAQQIVTTARNRKMTRLKQAKDEAEREVATYRTSLEEEYQRKVSDSKGNSGCNVKRLDEETELKIKKLKDATSSIRSDVVQMLMKHVNSVRT